MRLVASVEDTQQEQLIEEEEEEESRATHVLSNTRVITYPKRFVLAAFLRISYGTCLSQLWHE